MPKKIGDPTLHDLKKLEELTGVTAFTLRKFLKNGRLTGRKLGARWLVPEASLKEYFERGKKDSG